MRKDDKAGERLAKVIARAGLTSRREAETWIAAGRVKVNGATVGSPALNVSPDDRVMVDGRMLPVRERTRLFLFHKPRGLVTTHADPQGRPTVFGALPKNLPRLISIGRLDANTEGLLLLTNDGGLARLLELPATGWTRRYRVRANGRVTQERLDALRRGITIDGVRYGPIEARLDREQGANVWLAFAMREGKNREVKNVLGHLGLAVNRLIRVSFGPFQLGALPVGEIEEVRTKHLREQFGDKVAAAAGLDFSAPVAVAANGEGGERDEPGGTAEGRGPMKPGRNAPLADARRKPAHPGGKNQRASRGAMPAPKREGGTRERPGDAYVRKTPQRSHKHATSPADRGKDKKARRAAERIGEPALARRERKRRPFRGTPR